MSLARVVILLALIAPGCDPAGPSTTRPTTHPHEDPAKRVARDLSRYLSDARVHSVEVRVHSAEAPLNNEDEPALLIDGVDEIAALVKDFVDALAADDLREGEQWHQPVRNVHVRFVIKEGPDVRLNNVGFDMFWTTKSDDEPHSNPEWINLQTPALTDCFRKQLDPVWPATRPHGRAG